MYLRILRILICFVFAGGCSVLYAEDGIPFATKTYLQTEYAIELDLTGEHYTCGVTEDKVGSVSQVVVAKTEIPLSFDVEKAMGVYNVDGQGSLTFYFQIQSSSPCTLSIKADELFDGTNHLSYRISVNGKQLEADGQSILELHKHIGDKFTSFGNIPFSIETEEIKYVGDYTGKIYFIVGGGA